MEVSQRYKPGDSYSPGGRGRDKQKENFDPEAHRLHNFSSFAVRSPRRHSHYGGTSCPMSDYSPTDTKHLPDPSLSPSGWWN